MDEARRGRLAGSDAAPARGEHHAVVADLGAVRVEHIASGELDGPERFVGDDDEWVVVLAGSAHLEVDGTDHHLGAGDWILLPAGTEHVLHETTPGTTWLAVHAPPAHNPPGR